MSPASNQRDHWPRHARQWSLVGAPLRPGAEDVAVAHARISQWTRAHGRAPRVLLLGATPELATLTLPEGSSLCAVDRSADMIGAIFPAEARARGARTVVADWRALPHHAGAFDIVLGDGCLACGRYPEDYRTLAGELARVLSADGLLSLRTFVQPERRETLDEIARAVHAGAVASFHALKWRVAMAVTPEHRNVAVTTILASFEALFPRRDELARVTGWPPEVIATIDTYRGSDVVYSFPSEAETLAALAPELDLMERAQGSYELNERCPSLAFSVTTSREARPRHHRRSGP